MSRSFHRRLLLMAGALPLLLALALVLGAPWWLDRDRLGAGLEANLSAVLGQPVRLDAPPTLQLRPLPWLVVPAIRVGNGPDAALGLTGLRLRLSPWPLLRRRVVVDALSLDALALRWRNPVSGGERELTVRSLSMGPWIPGGAGAIAGRLSLRGVTPDLAGEGLLSGRFALSEDGGTLIFDGLHIGGTDLRVGEGRGLALDLDLRGALELATLRLSVDQVELRSDTLLASADAVLVQDGDGVRLAGQLSLAPFDLRAWLGRHGYGPGRGSGDRLRRVSAGTGFEARWDPAGLRLWLRDGRLAVDDTLAGVGVAIRWPAGSPGLPVGQLTLAADRLDLDPYLAAGSAGAAGSVLPARDLADAPAAPPLGSPPTDRLELIARVDRLRLGGLAGDGIAVTARQQDGQRELEAVVAGFYGGRLAVQAGQGGAAPDELPVRLAAQASDLDLGALLRDATGGPAAMTGVATVDLDLNSRGREPLELRRQLGGRVAVAIRDGAITGVALEGLLGAAAGLGVGVADATRFAYLGASLEGSAGLFTSNDIDGRAERALLTGGGRVDAVAGTLDLALQATLVRPPGGGGIRELEGVPIPVAVTGPWGAPHWQVDTRAALAAAAGRALRERGGALDELGRQLGVPGLRDGLERGLRGLFGQ